MSSLRSLPSVEQLLQTKAAVQMVAEYGHSLTVDAIRAVLADVRIQYAQKQTLPDRQGILSQVVTHLKTITQPTLLPVINATGVVLHTNLGRAPLSQAALLAVAAASQGYSTLEFDLSKGQRGSRLVHAEKLLTQLTGTQAALVVNNNAAAVLLVLTTLARRKRVIISRTQLVEIGGGFRVPDVMKQSGAHLEEIGTTNRVHLSDYQGALEEPAALVLRAHHSNFRIIGFTSEPTLAEISEAAHQRNVLVMDDLGSGALLDTAQYGLGHEPTVQESLAAGADIVCFSGDKLLGGPQAGIIVGRSDLVAALKKHPLARAVRADKLCLAALSATLLHYLKDEAETQVPVWRMISLTPGEIRSRAEELVARLGSGQVTEGFSTVGGGSLPEETLPTYLVAFGLPQPNRVLSQLRAAKYPVIARVEQDQVVIDLRTVLPEQEEALVAALKQLVSKDKS